MIHKVDHDSPLPLGTLHQMQLYPGMQYASTTNRMFKNNI